MVILYSPVCGDVCFKTRVCLYFGDFFLSLEGLRSTEQHTQPTLSYILSAQLSKSKYQKELISIKITFSWYSDFPALQNSL